MAEKCEDELLRRIINVIRKTCESDIMIPFDNPLINPDTDLKLDLGLDSIALVVLQINIEECFGIQFDPLQDDFDEIFHKVNNVYIYVKKKLEDE